MPRSINPLPKFLVSKKELMPLLEAKGMTQFRFFMSIPLSPGQVMNFYRQPPGIHVLIRIRDTFGIDPFTILIPA